MGLMSSLTRRRLQRFRRIKRAYFAFLILVVLICVSVFAEFICNSRALVVKYNGDFYFPTFRFYSGSVFGEGYDHEADYRVLKERFSSEGQGNWVVMPPVQYNPYENDLTQTSAPPNQPSREHVMGTDDRGRDVFARLFYGFRISIFFSLILVTLSLCVSILIGISMGYFGGRYDLFLQRGIEIWASLPFLYLVMILADIFNPNFVLLLVIMVLFDWVGMTYYMRTEAYRERAKDYVFAAKALGISELRVILQHILPNSLVPVITYFPFKVVAGITALTSLDFLGYGLPAPTPSWGEMINQALNFLKTGNTTSYWLILSPFGCLVATLLLVTFIGEGVREAFDPREYAKYS